MTMHKQSDGLIWKLALAFGLGTGALWIALSILILISAGTGFANDRTDWGAGWGLVGVLLLGAGIAAIVGTLWHRHIVNTHR
jgi:hypothetical protein